MVTTTESILYQPLDLGVNGKVDASERTYQTVKNREGRRKFTAEDTSLLNALYLERTADGSYARTVIQLQEDFRTITGKTISRTSVYNKIDQTRKSRSRTIVRATPVAIELYDRERAANSITQYPVVSEELGRLENMTGAEATTLYQDLGSRAHLPALQRFLKAVNKEGDMALGQMRFYRNKRDWRNVDNIYSIGKMWLDVDLWASRIEDERLRNRVLKDLLPVLLVLQGKLTEEYNSALQEKEPWFKKVFSFASGR